MIEVAATMAPLLARPTPDAGDGVTLLAWYCWCGGGTLVVLWCINGDVVVLGYRGAIVVPRS
jgi:hypothetical protein